MLFMKVDYPGAFEQPIPGVLDGEIYRVSPWRSDVLGRAIRGDYPHESRTFDIAERAERRKLVKVVAGGAAVLGAAVIVTELRDLLLLQAELARNGIELQWTEAATMIVAGHAAMRAALGGGVATLVSDDLGTVLRAALAGGLFGGAVGLNTVRRAALFGSSSLRMLVVEPS